MLIATIKSKPLPNVTEGVIEPGFYELEVYMSLSDAAASGDPKGFLKKTIAEHLASCVHTTGIPLGEKAWHVRFTRFVRINFNLPDGFIA